MSEAVTVPSRPTPVAVSPPRASWRQRRRARRKARPMYARADRATVRSLTTLMLPLIGVAVTWYWYSQHDLWTAVRAAAVTVGAWLALSPIALWWAVSGLRRGTRFVITGTVCGALAGIGTVGLVCAVYAAAVGWVLLTGQPLPEPFQDVVVPLPDGIR